MGGTQPWPQPPPQAPQADAGSLAARLASLADDIAAEGGLDARAAIRTARSTTPGGRLALRLLAAIAEHERAEAQRAITTSLAAAKVLKNPGKGGHPRALDDEGEQLVLQMFADKVPIAQIARLAKTSRPTIRRILDRHGVRPRAEEGS